ncbi:MAG: hypothetical protein H6706_19585 [Myxococcales bacterium]|nr:hypothetical protein [Myxococcales bacterium]
MMRPLLALALLTACGGTPEVAPDPDHDGIVGAQDQCPDAPEDFDGFQDEDGCPDVDHDHEGAIVGDCPIEPPAPEVLSCDEDAP